MSGRAGGSEWTLNCDSSESEAKEKKRKKATRTREEECKIEGESSRATRRGARSSHWHSEGTGCCIDYSLRRQEAAF